MEDLILNDVMQLDVNQRCCNWCCYCIRRLSSRVAIQCWRLVVAGGGVMIREIGGGGGGGSMQYQYQYQCRGAAACYSTCVQRTTRSTSSIR
jgi:hypothetical protein